MKLPPIIVVAISFLLPFSGGNLYFYIKKPKKLKDSSEYGVYCVSLHIIYNIRFHFKF